MRIEQINETIRQLESEAQKITIRIEFATAQGAGETYQTDQLQASRKGLRDPIEEQRTVLVSNTTLDGQSLNSMLIDFKRLDLNVRVSEEALTASMTSLTEATEATEAAVLGRRVFQVVVPSSMPAAWTHPKVFPNLLLSLLLLMCVFGIVRVFSSAPTLR